MNNPQALSRTTISLHWIVAILIISIATAGLIMKYGEVWALYPIHKSMGVLALVVILPRVIWRIKKGWPTPISEGQAYEHKLAKAIHWALISATLAMPFSGMLLSAASGHGFGIFGFELVPANHAITNPEEIVPHSESLTALGYFLHSWVGYTLLAAIALHVAGALKHHIIDKDATLKRMLGRNK